MGNGKTSYRLRLKFETRHFFAALRVIFSAALCVMDLKV
jgi:hypothetical protein